MSETQVAPCPFGLSLRGALATEMASGKAEHLTANLHVSGDGGAGVSFPGIPRPPQGLPHLRPEPVMQPPWFSSSGRVCPPALPVSSPFPPKEAILEGHRPSQSLGGERELGGSGRKWSGVNPGGNGWETG